MLSRRALVGRLAAGAAVAWAAGGGRTKVAFARGRMNTSPSSGPGHAEVGAAVDRLTPAAEGTAPSLEAYPAAPVPAAPVERSAAAAPVTAAPPWELVRPLALGTEVAHGWRVAELSGVVDGVCV